MSKPPAHPGAEQGGANSSSSNSSRRSGGSSSGGDGLGEFIHAPTGAVFRFIQARFQGEAFEVITRAVHAAVNNNREYEIKDY